MSTHPMSLTRSARVPRTVDCAEARASAPKTNETPDPTAVLLASLTDAVRTLQGIVARQGEEIASLKSDVKTLYYASN